MASTESSVASETMAASKRPQIIITPTIQCTTSSEPSPSLLSSSFYQQSPSFAFDDDQQRTTITIAETASEAGGRIASPREDSLVHVLEDDIDTATEVRNKFGKIGSRSISQYSF